VGKREKGCSLGTLGKKKDDFVERWAGQGKRWKPKQLGHRLNGGRAGGERRKGFHLGNGNQEGGLGAEKGKGFPGGGSR